MSSRPKLRRQRAISDGPLRWLRTRLAGRKMTTLLLGAMLGMGVGASLLQSCETVKRPDILQMVANAKTPADHAAIAEYFEREAAANEAEARFHRKLGQTYREFHNSYKVNMVPHCDEAAQDYAKIAAEDSALAQEHRKLAQGAK